MKKEENGRIWNDPDRTSKGIRRLIWIVIVLIIGIIIIAQECRQAKVDAYIREKQESGEWDW